VPDVRVWLVKPESILIMDFPMPTVIQEGLRRNEFPAWLATLEFIERHRALYEEAM